jgi:hypothetical protein
MWQCPHQNHACDIYELDDRCHATTVLLWIASTWSLFFFFFYFSFLAMCILDFYTFFRHYVIVEVGRIWYHIGINIFPLLKRKYFWCP